MEQALRNTNKTKHWCLCVGVKREKWQEHLPTFQARAEGVICCGSSGVGLAGLLEVRSSGLPHAADRPRDEGGRRLERSKN